MGYSLSQKLFLAAMVLFIVLAFTPTTWYMMNLFLFLAFSAFFMFILDVMFGNTKDFEYEPNFKNWVKENTPAYWPNELASKYLTFHRVFFLLKNNFFIFYWSLNCSHSVPVEKGLLGRGSLIYNSNNGWFQSLDRKHHYQKPKE